MSAAMTIVSTCEGTDTDLQQAVRVFCHAQTWKTNWKKP